MLNTNDAKVINYLGIPGQKVKQNFQGRRETELGIGASPRKIFKANLLYVQGNGYFGRHTLNFTLY